MSRQPMVFAVGCGLAGFVAVVSLAYWIGSRPAPAAPSPPELGGQKVPDRLHDIAFDREYDVYCSFFTKPTIYEKCKIVGFTGRGEESTGGAGRSRLGVFSSPSGSGSSYYERYFEHWLVLRLADGRLAYIPPSAIKYIEEARAKAE